MELKASSSPNYLWSYSELVSEGICLPKCSCWLLIPLPRGFLRCGVFRVSCNSNLHNSCTIMQWCSVILIATLYSVIPALSVVTTALSFIEVRCTIGIIILSTSDSKDNLQVAYYSSLVDGIATACVCINLGSKKFGHDTLHSLQVNLLSHFFMNLRDANTDATGGTLHASQMTDPRFNRVVGNLAGSISYDADSEADEDDAEGTDMENDSGSGDGPERGEVTEASGDTTSRHNDVL